MGNGQTLRGEDEGEGEITTLPIAYCGLDKTKNNQQAAKSNQQLK